MSLNQCNFIGNLTRDPELRYTPSNMAITSFGLALNHKWKDKATGDMKEEVTFIDCEAWGKTAETLAKYVGKGDPLYVEGRLKLDTWEDKASGQKRSKLKVVAEVLQFLPDGKGGAQGGGGGADIGPLQTAFKTAQFGFTTVGNRYFDYHHASTDVFENVHERELHMGAVVMAAMVYLVDKYGL